MMWTEMAAHGIEVMFDNPKEAEDYADDFKRMYGYRPRVFEMQHKTPKHFHRWKYNGFLGTYVCVDCGAETEDSQPTVVKGRHRGGTFPWGF